MNSILSANLRRGVSQSIRLQNKSQVLSSSTAFFNDSNVSSINKSMNMNGRTFSSLPYHIVVGMPALSPTMDAGTISSWNVAEGDSFAAGDSVAEIETDKATIDFEAQDDGVVAKLLVEAGSGEIGVGVPIMVTVEEEEDVAAFKDFVPEATEEPVAAEAPAPVVEEVAPPPPAPVAAPAPVAVPEPAPVIAAAPEPVAPPVVAADITTDASMVSPGWGNFARVKSPLASTLSASQKKYIEMYGSTGQMPL